MMELKQFIGQPVEIVLVNYPAITNTCHTLNSVEVADNVAILHHRPAVLPERNRRVVFGVAGQFLVVHPDYGLDMVSILVAVERNTVRRIVQQLGVSVDFAIVAVVRVRAVLKRRHQPAERLRRELRRGPDVVSEPRRSDR